MWYIVLHTILTKYLRDIPHLSNHQNVLPSTLQKRNAFSFQDIRVQMYVRVHVRNGAREHISRPYAVYKCMCMRVYVCNKGQRKGSVYSSYWRPRRSMRIGYLSTLTKRTPTHQSTITTHTRTVKYHGRVCFRTFLLELRYALTYVDLLGILKFLILFAIFLSPCNLPASSSNRGWK